MSRSAALLHPGLQAVRAAVLDARLAPAIRIEPVLRRLMAHATLAGGALPIVGWPLAVLWFALALTATVGAAVVAQRRLAQRRSAPTMTDCLAPAAGAYGAPALLALLASAQGPWGMAAGGFVIGGLTVQALGNGDLRASRRWLRRRYADLRARLKEPPEPARLDPAPAARSADSGNAMRTLLADLLDLSSLQAGRLEVRTSAFDLRGLIAAAVREWRPEARRKGLGFVLSGAAKAPRWVEGDPVRIRQVLDTLLANALKFTTAGSISMTVGAEPRGDGQVDLTLSVLDSGPGMTGDQFANLFNAYDRYEATPRAGPGLSRHLARELARLMGGDLTASSAPGLGAAFSLELPLALAKDGRAEVDTARGLRVLVVDDHAVYRHAFSLILQTVCREVVCAEDGIEALDLLAAEPFDLVLMDLAMPRLGGLAATRRLRSSSSRARDVAVIALTALDSDEDRAACLAAGMNAFVSKPVDARELLGAIHAVLSGEAIAKAA